MSGPLDPGGEMHRQSDLVECAGGCTDHARPDCEKAGRCVYPEPSALAGPRQSDLDEPASVPEFLAEMREKGILPDLAPRPGETADDVALRGLGITEMSQSERDFRTHVAGRALEGTAPKVATGDLERLVDWAEEQRQSGFRDQPKRITVDDGNPAGPLVYDLGSVNVALTRERDELRAEVERMRPVAEAAIAVSDADLSVYDDVPNAHDLMNQLEAAVAAYQEARNG